MDSLELNQKYSTPHFINNKSFPFNRTCQITDITHTCNFKYVILTGIGSTIDERYGGILAGFDFYIFMDGNKRRFPITFIEKTDGAPNLKKCNDDFAKKALKKFITDCINNEYYSIVESYWDDISSYIPPLDKDNVPRAGKFLGRYIWGEGDTITTEYTGYIAEDCPQK